MATTRYLTHYWVFDENELNQALAEYMQRMPTSSLAAGGARKAIEGFLHSKECIGRGMRRGNHDEQQ